MSDVECPFCGELHERPARPYADGPFAGWMACDCPRVPPGHIYFDAGFDSGPRGLLFSMADLVRGEQ